MTYSVGRLGSDSRCCRPSDPAWVWIDYVDGEHDAVTEIEEWLNSLAPFARNHELGRIDALMEAAEKGMLEDSGDEVTPIKPIRHDPEVFELRHQALKKKLRFYHGEPGEVPEGLVALHRHIKIDDEHQQAQIIVAVARYEEGRPSFWGMVEQP